LFTPVVPPINPDLVVTTKQREQMFVGLASALLAVSKEVSMESVRSFSLMKGLILAMGMAGQTHLNFSLIKITITVLLGLFGKPNVGLHARPMQIRTSRQRTKWQNQFAICPFLGVSQFTDRV
jgi:hypothetical protein